jgi:enoyl-CoA hydratase/carnithine racemase
VAAVSGHAVGAGFDLALWCDFRIVEDTAVLGCYARKFGNCIFYSYLLFGKMKSDVLYFNYC